MRWCAASGISGLAIRGGESLEVAASRDAFGCVMVIRREPGELYALRHDLPRRGGPLAGPVEGWVERLDPETLEAVASTARLPASTYWPGGIAAHACGDLHAVFGRWAWRLDHESLEVLASHELPVDRPHNSFVVLDSGELVTKDCDAPAGQAPSTVSVLDPESLEPVAPPLTLPEPSVARLSSDGAAVIALGTTDAYRLVLDRSAGRLLIDPDWRPSYGPAPGRSYGWDPVITDEHVLWMDQGRNAVDTTMLGAGSSPDPVRLWWARRDSAEAVFSTEISGLPYGTESNPPAWDPTTRTVIAYDAGNAVLRAWRMEGDALTALWRRDGLAHAGHLIVYPDTRELVVQDFQQAAVLRSKAVRPALRRFADSLGRFEPVRRGGLALGRDEIAVLDLDTGQTKATVGVPSPCQAFLFPAPGFNRDVYYQSMTTIARVRVSAAD